MKRLRKIAQRGIEHCISILDLQMALTAISLPFIIGWGLPISIISVAGNILFGPFLTAFLLIASFLFITQLLHIPNGIFMVLLEWCNALWSTILNFTSSVFLVSVPTVPSWALALLFVFACFILCFGFSKGQRLLFYTIFLISVLGSLKLYALFHHNTLTIRTGSKSLTFIKTSDQLMCIDSGLRSSRGLQSWVFYTVLPELRKHLGTTTITSYVALHPNKVTPEFCRLCTIHHATLFMPDNEWLDNYVIENQCKTQVITHECLSNIMLGNWMVTLKPLDTNPGYCYAQLHNNHYNAFIVPHLRRAERYQMQCHTKTS